MSGTPRPYDENFIDEQFREMIVKGWHIRDIAGWFARWGYEEGKAVMMRKKEEKVEMSAPKAASMDDCKYRDRLTPHGVEPKYGCGRGSIQPGCRYCKQNFEEEVVKVEQQWEEIRIEDVQPGDVARCNGREFPVEGSVCAEWYVRLERNYAPINGNSIFEKLGFTFHRKVKREHRSGVATVLGYKNQSDGDLNWIDVPLEVPQGTTLRWTVILDGEDGA